MVSPVDTIARIEARLLNVSPRTNWYFLQVQTDTGRIGWGEASLNKPNCHCGNGCHRSTPEPRLMADCHWRFSSEAALALLPRLDPLKLHWFECPISESVDCWQQARLLRQAANERDVLIAAAESQVGLRAFQRTFEQKLFDVVMPDVKYCGGPLEMMAIALAAGGCGVQCSPHNPAGENGADSPAITEVTAGVAPLYGTWVISKPAKLLSNSIDMCEELPMPPLA